MMGLDNPLHIAFLLVIVLVVFGAKRLPEMGQSLGAGLRGFKHSLSGETDPTTLSSGPEATRDDRQTVHHAVADAAETVSERVPAPPVG
ncbi:MAG: twin-arginine translocase TatA/TatE family subunit [Solirubrobacterales bacterium]|nr:twin-arginine translocase TatA/TatE family subunit [Solirubrobacterales bacterium]MBV9943498.1 twin-arginine translocase TatA/TatE family subunit [Solirubrobacterales bacterium]